MLMILLANYLETILCIELFDIQGHEWIHIIIVF